MTTTAKNPNSTARLVIVLFAITAIVALLLGLTNYITADKIEAITAEKTAKAFSEVLPGEYSFEELDGNFELDSGKLTGVYEAKNGSALGGYVVRLSVSGSQGDIDMAVGVGTDGKVSGVSIIGMSETAGLGSKASDEGWRSQFIGADSALAVNKDGGTIDALTGATVTSRAVTNGVNSALSVVSGLLG